jgi:hypothetical protein
MRHWQSAAFVDDVHGEVEKLIVEGYVLKDGDLYELTPRGEKILAGGTKRSLRSPTTP